MVDDSLWIADAGQSHLVRIDLGKNEVVATIPVDPSDLVAGDERLWTVSPVGVGPVHGPTTLSRVDLEGNRVVPTDFPVVDAAGLGSLWSIAEKGGLEQVDPKSGRIESTWPDVKGQQVDAACGALWVHDGDRSTLTWFDPSSGRAGAAIPTQDGAGRVHQTSDGCWVVFGSPGDPASSGRGSIARIDEHGIAHESPLLVDRVHVIGDGFWTSTVDGVIQQIDPMTAAPVGHAWVLPSEQLPSNPKFADWRLIGDGSRIYLLTGGALSLLDVQADTASR